MSPAKHFLVLLACAAGSSCAASPHAPGMVVVASSSLTSGPDAILVAFPTTACTGSDSAVFIDEKGGFVGSIAPGTAAYLAFPPDGRRLLMVSSRDVTAPAGTWFRRHEIAPPTARVEHGMVVDVRPRDGKSCSREATPSPELVTFEEATRAAKDLKWLDVLSAAGTRWLDEHRPRVTELLGPLPPRS